MTVAEVCLWGRTVGTVSTDGAGELRSGQINAGEGYGYWIIKLDAVANNRDKEAKDAPCYTRIEYAYHRMALAAGIVMSECRLYRENGRYHFMTRRFDRESESGKKLHMQTLGALAHMDYNVPGRHSYEEAAGIMRKLHLTQREAEEFYRRMVFNVLARNQDDHVKNISFLMDKSGTWHLSPAYDITYAYQPGGAWTGAHQMTINGKTEDITERDLLRSAVNMNLRESRARTVIADVRAAVSDWMSYAEEAMVPEEKAEAIRRVLLASDRNVDAG